MAKFRKVMQWWPNESHKAIESNTRKVQVLYEKAFARD